MCWSLQRAEREWAACGADHTRRVRRLEEHVEIWRMLWRRERADEALARRGRSLPGCPLCVYTTVRFEDDVRTAERRTGEFLAAYYGGGVHMRGTMGLGPTHAVIAALRRYADAGVTDLCLRFVGDDQFQQFE